jgi:hypothetical protein
MAIFYCKECDNYIDNDWYPCVPYKGDLICEDCAETLGIDHDGYGLIGNRPGEEEDE